MRDIFLKKTVLALFVLSVFSGSDGWAATNDSSQTSAAEPTSGAGFSPADLAQREEAAAGLVEARSVHQSSDTQEPTVSVTYGTPPYLMNTIRVWSGSRYITLSDTPNTPSSSGYYKDTIDLKTGVLYVYSRGGDHVYRPGDPEYVQRLRVNVDILNHAIQVLSAQASPQTAKELKGLHRQIAVLKSSLAKLQHLLAKAPRKRLR